MPPERRSVNLHPGEDLDHIHLLPLFLILKPWFVTGAWDTWLFSLLEWTERIFTPSTRSNRWSGRRWRIHGMCWRDHASEWRESEPIGCFLPANVWRTTILWEDVWWEPRLRNVPLRCSMCCSPSRSWDLLERHTMSWLRPQLITAQRILALKLSVYSQLWFLLLVAIFIFLLSVYISVIFYKLLFLVKYCFLFKLLVVYFLFFNIFCIIG